jgi:hypothetical protein
MDSEIQSDMVFVLLCTVSSSLGTETSVDRPNDYMQRLLIQPVATSVSVHVHRQRSCRALQISSCTKTDDSSHVRSWSRNDLTVSDLETCKSILSHLNTLNPQPKKKTRKRDTLSSETHGVIGGINSHSPQHRISTPSPIGKEIKAN